MIFLKNTNAIWTQRKRIDFNASFIGVVVLSALVAAYGGGEASASSPVAPSSPQGSTPATASVTTSWGVINEPAYPASAQVCATLTANLTAVNNSADSLDSDPLNSNPDTTRIQSAINNCTSGQAVKLVVSTAGANAFISGALTLKSGITLWVDKGVTLFASRNPSDFDNGVGACGTATTAKRQAASPSFRLTVLQGAALSAVELSMGAEAVY